MLDAGLPLGGMKQSGTGRDLGRAGAAQTLREPEILHSSYLAA